MFVEKEYRMCCIREILERTNIKSRSSQEYDVLQMFAYRAAGRNSAYWLHPRDLI